MERWIIFSGRILGSTSPGAALYNFDDDMMGFKKDYTVAENPENKGEAL